MYTVVTNVSRIVNTIHERRSKRSEAYRNEPAATPTVCYFWSCESLKSGMRTSNANTDITGLICYHIICFANPTVLPITKMKIDEREWGDD